jgi:hypothetical protein
MNAELLSNLVRFFVFVKTFAKFLVFATIYAKFSCDFQEIFRKFPFSNDFRLFEIVSTLYIVQGNLLLRKGETRRYRLVVPVLSWPNINRSSLIIWSNYTHISWTITYFSWFNRNSRYLVVRPSLSFILPPFLKFIPTVDSPFNKMCSFGTQFLKVIFYLRSSETDLRIFVGPNATPDPDFIVFLLYVTMRNISYLPCLPSFISIQYLNVHIIIPVLLLLLHYMGGGAILNKF